MTTRPNNTRVSIERATDVNDTRSIEIQHEAPTHNVEAPTTSIDQSPAPHYGACDPIHNFRTTMKEASQVVAAAAYQQKRKVQHEDLTLAELQRIEAERVAHVYLPGQRPKRKLSDISLKDELERREALIAIRTARIVANNMLIASMRKANRSVTCKWCQGDGCRACGQTGKEVADGFRIGVLLIDNQKLQREQELIAQHGTPNNKPMPFGQWRQGMWYTRSTSKHDENTSFRAEAQNG